MKRKRRAFSVLIFFLLIALFSLNVFAADSPLKVSSDVTSLRAGQSLTVRVKAETKNRAFTARLDADSAVFEKIESGDITLLGAFDRCEYNSENKMLAAAATGKEPSEIVFEVSLRVKTDVQSEKASFGIFDFSVSDGERDINLGNAELTFDVPSGGSSSSDSSEPSGDNSGNKQSLWEKIVAFFLAIIAAIKALFGGKRSSAAILATLLVPAMALAAPSFTDEGFEKFDLDKDLRISASDVVPLEKALVGLEASDASAFDLNFDRKVSVTDLFIEADYISKFENTFSDVSEMKKYNAKEGETLSTLGYYKNGDGGAAAYIVVKSNGTADELASLTLENGLVAKLLETDEVTSVKAFGAKGDGKTDDLKPLILAANSGFKSISLGSESYYLSGTLEINADNSFLKGENATIFTDKSFEKAFVSVNGKNVKLKNLNVFVSLGQKAQKNPGAVGYYSPLENVNEESNVSVVAVSGTALFESVGIAAEKTCGLNLLFADGKAVFSNGKLSADESNDIASLASGNIEIKASTVDCEANYTDSLFNNVETLENCSISFNARADIILNYKSKAKNDISVRNNNWTMTGTRLQDSVFINLENELCENAFIFEKNTVVQKEENERKTLINCNYKDSALQNVQLSDNVLSSFVVPRYENGFDFSFEGNSLNGAVQNVPDSSGEYKTVSTVNELSKANLHEGEKVQTKGYYAEGDGGASKFVISSKKDGAVKAIDIENGLYAVMQIENDSVNLMQFGVKGDGITDDSDAIEECFNSDASNIIIPHAEYKIERSISLKKSGKNIFANDSVIFTDDTYAPERGSEFLIKIVSDDCSISGLAVEARETTLCKNLYCAQVYVGDATNVKLVLCDFLVPETASSEHGYNNLDLYTGWHNVLVQNCTLTLENEAGSGGCIWIRDLLERKADNLKFLNNKCFKRTHDEILAVFMGYIKNVEIAHCSFTMPDNEKDRTVMCFTMGSGSSKEADNIKFEYNNLDCNSSMSLMFMNDCSNLSVKGNKIKYTKANVESNNFIFYNSRAGVENVTVSENDFEIFNESSQKITAFSSFQSKAGIENNKIKINSDIAEAFNGNAEIRENEITFMKTVHVISNRPPVFEGNTVNLNGQTDIFFQYYGGEIGSESRIKNNVFNCFEITEGSCIMAVHSCKMNGFVPSFTGNTVNAPNAIASKNRLYFVDISDETAQKIDMTVNTIEGFKGSYMKYYGVDHTVDLNGTVFK